jgi:hypothetical protein
MSDVWDKQHGGSHYQKYKIQPSKGKKQDLLKAIHFIEMIIERDYS